MGQRARGGGAGHSDPIVCALGGAESCGKHGGAPSPCPVQNHSLPVPTLPSSWRAVTLPQSPPGPDLVPDLHSPSLSTPELPPVRFPSKVEEARSI